jgi:hypothetical protein
VPLKGYDLEKLTMKCAKGAHINQKMLKGLCSLKQKINSELAESGRMRNNSNISANLIFFKTNLGYESGDQVGVFDEKTEVKNLVQVYL